MDLQSYKHATQTHVPLVCFHVNNRLIVESVFDMILQYQQIGNTMIISILNVSHLQSVDCSWASWGAWGDCCLSTQQRSRIVATAANNGGTSCCGSPTEDQYCTALECGKQIIDHFDIYNKPINKIESKAMFIQTPKFYDSRMLQ